ncbi:NACHT%2C LRR and PYD domains-containing protein 12-like isoform X1 [Xyrichtys novacula]|uniref:NACHT, LRR and PYD domains-containing protein 12-like isoform X1 n=1 Tax=Xyrichtys novacula TaxID=13765 RepID=A0AAV1EZW7_XYRNO|nr:NACHT%2C LRR and PYD domains-containing protein 12-like isoform X1 [Xyrichtys novacula]
MEEHQIMESVKQELKVHLREKFTFSNEGASTAHSQLENIDTRLLIAGEKGDHDSQVHEILDHFKLPDKGSPPSDYAEISCFDIFKPGGNVSQQQPTKDGTIRRVMMKGMAGIGKTVAVQNFSLNWAEGESNQHIDFIFVLPFKELNMLKEGEYTLLQLLVPLYPELRHVRNTEQLFTEQVLLIFDGLDECRFPLDFDGGARMIEPDGAATVDVLLTNLIKGDLLPGALLWITSRPAAVGQIPSKYIDQVTEVQGFTDQQRDEYFVKQFSAADQANEALSCLKEMVSFCFTGHVPMFCWILAEVLKKGWDDQRSRRITTMTELYIYYLVIQTQRSEQSEKAQKKKSAGDTSMIFNLSKLAFEQLQKGNIIFYEEDLRECGIDSDGFCSEILKEECVLYKKKMFGFVHFSFQEFLAALYFFHCCVTKNISAVRSFLEVDPTDLGLLELQKRVIDKALKSEKGMLDLFLCFFLGFSLESNQTTLQSVLPQTKSDSETVAELRKYLRSFNAGNVPQERCMNLLLCKYELKEERFQDDIRMFLETGAELSPMDCWVLSTMLQISGELVEELDLTKCVTPSYGTEKLLMRINTCKKAVLGNLHLKENYLDLLLSILRSPDSHLRELHLLCSGTLDVPVPHMILKVLGDPVCKLQTLRLSGLTLDFGHCHTLACVLQSKQSSLRALDLTNCMYSYQQDESGYYSRQLEENKKEFKDELTLLTFIPAGLIGPVCKLEKFSMSGCRLTDKCCQVFASVLSSNSQLRELDLSQNNLQDLGVRLLSAGLRSSKCRLEKLRLSFCGITEEGCVSLASALRTNPSHLRELDLSYNHPGEAGVKLLSERLQDPECKLEKLNIEQNEEFWTNPQLLNKYVCDLTLDPNTVGKNLLLSENQKKVVSTSEEQPYPDHPERFDDAVLVMCREGLTGRCYWEVEWAGCVTIGVAYKTLKRKGHLTLDTLFNKSWMSISTGSGSYSFIHGRSQTYTPVPVIDLKANLARQKRLGLFLDWSAGSLSFYSLFGDKKTHLHTFYTTFTEPLYPLFSVLGSSYVTVSTAETPGTDDNKFIFTPRIMKERLGISYRFTFPCRGVFECSLTKLVFKVTKKGEVTYKTLIWNDTLLEHARKVPAGPQFSFGFPEDSVCQLHLPHCETEPGLPSEGVSVVNITDDGMSVIQPLQITETHVVVETPHSSIFGLVKNITPTPVLGKVVLFLRPAYRRGMFILSVILLPRNVPLPEVIELYDNCEYIEAPSDCLLLKYRDYSLHSDPEDYTIQPERAEFYENYGPNYHASFEINLTRGTEEVTLMVRAQKKTVAWSHCLRLSALSSGENATTEEKLLRARTKFIERVSDPVLDELMVELVKFRVVSDAEVKEARVKQRADKARDVIDMVRRKGNEASQVMINILSSCDPFLCETLRFT